MEWVWSKPKLEKAIKTPRYEIESIVETALSDTMHNTTHDSIYTRNSNSNSYHNEQKSKYNFIQKTSNPYMVKNNYIKDLHTQDKYLRPINSNSDFNYENKNDLKQS